MTGAGDRSARASSWLVIAGVLVAALSLRGPIVAPTPVLRDIEADLGIGAATSGLLTTAPVLMFALLTPLAALAIRRAGAEIAVLLSLAGVLVGTVIRALPGFGWMLAGSFVIGAAVTIGNVVIPVVIRRDVSVGRVPLVTAAYVAMLNVGSLVTSLLTAPLAAAIGWPAALLAWSAITVAGLALWTRHLRSSRARAAADNAQAVLDREQQTLTGPVAVVSPARRSVLRHPIAWLLVIAFSGQVFIYYALSTWLPAFAVDELGASAAGAGALASLYQGGGVVGAFVVPLLIRFAPRGVPAVAICVSWLVLVSGLLGAAHLLWLWLLVGAVGHAGGFVVIFSAMVAVARDDAEAATMSALVQGGGYAVGALGPPVVGAIHEATGSWTPGLLVILAVTLAYCVALLVAIGAAGRVVRR